MNSLVKSFVVGSSLPATVWTFSYLGAAYRKHPTDALPMTAVPIAVPALFGIVNAAVNAIPTSTSIGYTIRMFIVGALFGLGLSLFGTFGLNLPVKLFQAPPSERFKYLLIAPIIYAFIWGIVVNYLNRYFGLVKFK